MEQQIESRELVICRFDYWPSLTPDRVRQIAYSSWPALALACDAMAKARADEAAEMERMRRR